MNADPQFPLPDVTWEPARPFWEGAARHELRLPRCRACGTLNACGEPRCRACAASAFDWDVLSGRATVYSWTTVHRAFLPQFADQVPFTTGLVAVAEDPDVRVVTGFVDCRPDELRVDLPVEAVFRPLRATGVIGEVIAPFFRPIRG
jgi:uncharacterized OB-fold protein